MRKQTDLAKVKQTARSLLFTDIHETEFSPVIVSHPFTDSGFVASPNANGEIGLLNITESDADQRRWREYMGKLIDGAKSAYEIYMMITKPYGLTFLKYTAQDLSQEDLSNILASAWTRAEAPNMDVNVSKAKLLSLFKQADPTVLMEQDEYVQFNVPFHYKNFLGYRKGADGKPEIDPEEAETIRFVYERFLAGDSLLGIAQKLNDLQVPTPSGKGLWQNSTIQSILSNEKYKGDAIINKTYIKDCLSKKVMVNNGERPKYYVENNHPAIIDAVTFGRVQEELARRSGKPKTKQVGTKTEQGKYSSKYAMTELLVCGECKTPYRRCTWTVKGQKKIVWRCINRLDFGKKYCHNSPTVEESILQRAVMRAIMETAQQNLGVLQTLKVHIGMGLQSEQTEDNSMELQIRIAEIDAEFKAMLAKISTDTVDAFDEEKAKQLMDEKARLQQQLDNIRDGQLKREQTQSRLDDIYTILDGLKNRPMEYDEQIVRQLLE